MNKAKLKSVMALYEDTNETLAKYLGISMQSFSSKINEKVLPSGKKAEFTQNEIRAMIRKYNLTPDDVDAIFFG